MHSILIYLNKAGSPSFFFFCMELFQIHYFCATFSRSCTSRSIQSNWI